MTTQHKNITVSGMVQGVGFRYACLKMARTTGINGFVKNLPNGKVYIEAEGNESQLKVFIRWCYSGPSHAYVQSVNIVDGETVCYNNFDIKP
ncbi:MAG TPA: acylphosphatase [Bacteroidales bacterium]|jgi:acylphosphatase|nr:acylphosphatase [Bacteroidales bacterium]